MQSLDSIITVIIISTQKLHPLFAMHACHRYTQGRGDVLIVTVLVLAHVLYVPMFLVHAFFFTILTQCTMLYTQLLLLVC